MKKLKFGFSIFTLLTVSLLLVSCSSNPPVQQQRYAKLRTAMEFENEFHVVWKAIERTLRDFRVTSRDPQDVNDTDLRKLKERKLETDWINSQSKEKYIEYQVNGFPRKKYLQVRYRYKVLAESTGPGVTRVTVSTDEEIERLAKDGSPDGWESAETPETTRINDLLERIKMAILAAIP